MLREFQGYHKISIDFVLSQGRSEDLGGFSFVSANGILLGINSSSQGSSA